MAGQVISYSQVGNTDYVGILRSMSRDLSIIMDPMIKSKALADSSDGTIAGKAFRDANSVLEGKSRLDAVEGVITDMSRPDANYSDSWKSAFLSQVYPERDKAGAAARTAETNSNLNAIATSYQSIAADISSGKEGAMLPEEYVDTISTVYALPKDKVRDATYSGFMRNSIDMVKSANNPTDLIKAMGAHSTVVKHFETPFFKTSSSRDTQQVVAQLDREYTRELQNKGNAFKQQGQMEINNMIEEGYKVHPLMASKSFDKAHPSNELSRGNALREYTKQYEKHETIRGFMSANKPGMPHGIVPKEAKQQWQQAVTQQALTTFMAGDTSGFIDTITNDIGYSKEVGTQLYTAYLSTKSSKELAPYMQQMENISMMPNGSTSLSQSIGATKYAEILTTSAVADVLYEGDMLKARNYIQQQKTNPVKQSWDDDLLETVNENSISLGHLGNQYKATMTTMNNIDPLVAKVNEGKARKYYEGLKSEWDTSSWYNPFGGESVSIDTSMGKDITEGKEVNPDAANIAREAIIEAAMGINPTLEVGTLYMMGDNVFVTDAYGSNGVILNAKEVLKSADNYLLEQANTKIFNVPVTENVVSWAADTVDKVGEDISQYNRDMGDKSSTGENLFGADRWKAVKQLFTGEGL